MHLEVVSPFGFCSGVNRAIRIVKDALKKRRNYYSLGPIIHNSYVIEELSKRGLKLIKDLNSFPKSSLLFLPTHGTSSRLIKSLKERRINFVDLTCPYVSQVQRICQDLENKDFKVIIIGDREHPEIRVLNEIAKDAIVIDRKADLLDNSFLQTAKKVGVIFQTTQSKDKYLQLASNLIKKYSGIKELHIFNTICPDSLKRQEGLKRLAKRVDLMIIIGGKDSANTRRLYRIAKKIRKRSYHIESQKDFNRLPMGRQELESLSIGIASGASTPQILVRRVIKDLKRWKKI